MRCIADAGAGCARCAAFAPKVGASLKLRIQPLYMAAASPQCGTPLSVSMSAENAFRFFALPDTPDRGRDVRGGECRTWDPLGRIGANAEELNRGIARACIDALLREHVELLRGEGAVEPASATMRLAMSLNLSAPPII